jgi:hypothetical protein
MQFYRFQYEIECRFLIAYDKRKTKSKNILNKKYRQT